MVTGFHAVVIIERVYLGQQHYAFVKKMIGVSGVGREGGVALDIMHGRGRMTI